MDEKISYKDWKTEKEKEYILGAELSVVESEKLINLICPFDQTPLIERHTEHNNPKIICINCGANYGNNYSENDQEKINQLAKYHFKRNKENLDELNKKRANLISRIKKAEEMIFYQNN